MMLKFNLPRDSTFKKEKPKNCQLKEINSKNIPKQLLPFFDLSNKFFYLISDNRILKDKYIVKKKDKRIFIKIIKVENKGILDLTNSIENYIYRNKVNSLKFLEVFKCKLNKNTFLISYDYIENRFSRATEKDLVYIGKKLGELHRVLLFFPKSSLIKNYSMKRFTHINNLLKKILNSNQNVKIDSKKIEIIKKYKLKKDFFFNKNSQVIHGDLNYSNILFERQKSEPVFIDFETSCFSWEDPLFDIAQIIDRFILSQDKNQKNLIDAFVESYSDTIKRKVNINKLSTIIEQRSLKSILLLISKEHWG